MFRSALASFLIFVSSITFAVEIGDKAPQIIGRNIDGELFALSRMEAKPKVLNFFWVNCAPCIEEIPLLAKKAKKHPNVEFAVIHAAVNPDTGSNYDIEDIQAFSKKLPSYPKNLVLGSDRLKDIYDLKAYPYSVLLSADNTVEDILISYNKATVKKLEAWLSKQK
jgi:thiol-disulfide isomerase/thioredoxin